MVENFINIIKNDEGYVKKIEHIKKIPPRKAIHSQVHDIPTRLSDYLKLYNITPYQHQKQVLEYVRNGENVIITTPTASGKSLAFNLPVLEEFSNNTDSKALYIYPTKALSHDQLINLQRLEEDTGININAHAYDRDTLKKDRFFIRDNARIVLTNMFELHLILFWHFQWCKFYSNLKFVIIDESHKYRGVFGSNVAFLIRRLRRIAEYYGSNPQFILSSATLANPLEFSEKLVGKTFKLVDEDGSAKGEQNIVFFNPEKSDERSKKSDVQSLFSLMIMNDLQTICFTRTKNETEELIRSVKNYLKSKDESLSDRIASYRGGYEKEHRRYIEAGLKNRELIGVVSTNALEIGMNIGSLDAVLISSYPGTLTSTWQQAGRAGRGNETSLVILVASKNPLDQYIIKNPDFLLNGVNENAIIDLENIEINSNHILCASSEIPLTEYELKEFFPEAKTAFENLINEKKLVKGLIGWEYYTRGRDNPAMTYNLQRMDEEFLVSYKGFGEWTEKIGIEEAYSKSFVGAIHKYNGIDYVVSKVDIPQHTIEVEKLYVDSNYKNSKKTYLKILNKINTKKIHDFSFYYGTLQIKEEFLKYETINGRRVYSEVDVPPYIYESKGMWFELPNDYINNLETKFNDIEIVNQSVVGVLRSLLGLFPFYVMCDPCDIRGYVDKQEKKIFIYDSHPGGIGLSKKGIDVFNDLVKATYDMVKKCPCEDGCASCIYSTPCGINYDKLNKKGTIFLLEQILDEFNIKDESKVLKSSLKKVKKISKPIKSSHDKEEPFSKKDKTSSNLNYDDLKKALGNKSPVKVLLNDPDGSKRSYAANLLGKTKNPGYVNALCKATKDKNGNVRRLSASALGKIGDPRAINSLIKLLSDERDEVRLYAVKALGMIGDAESLSYLEKMLYDPIYYVKDSAEVAIKKIKSDNDNF